MKKITNVHVVPATDGWSAKTEGKSRAAKKFRRQSDAVEFARQMAIRNESELLIHGKDGQIREKNSYGNDPKNIQG